MVTIKPVVVLVVTCRVEPRDVVGVNITIGTDPAVYGSLYKKLRVKGVFLNLSK